MTSLPRPLSLLATLTGMAVGVALEIWHRPAPPEPPALPPVTEPRLLDWLERLQVERDFDDRARVLCPLYLTEEKR